MLQLNYSAQFALKSCKSLIVSKLLKVQSFG